MGTAESTRSAKHDEGRDIAEVVESMMPLYYDRNPPDRRVIQVAQASWREISENKALGADQCYKILDLTPDGRSHKKLFRDLFFYRFFDTHPYAKCLFSDAAIESGRFIGSLINTCFVQLDDEKDFRRKIVELAEHHCIMGVRTIEYGIVGDILFWTLHQMLGTNFTHDIEEAWVRMMSAILRIIVPIAVQYERTHGRAPRGAGWSDRVVVEPVSSDSCQYSFSYRAENSVVSNNSVNLLSRASSIEPPAFTEVEGANGVH
jgi:hemoglobin-like flavoprotein